MYIFASSYYNAIHDDDNDGLLSSSSFVVVDVGDFFIGADKNINIRTDFFFLVPN